MPITYTKPVSGTQLVTGIIGTVDVGSTIARAIELKLEIEHLETLRKEIHSYIATGSLPAIKTWQRWATQDFKEILTAVTSQLEVSQKVFTNVARDQIGLSITGFGGASNLKGMSNKLYASVEGIDTLVECIYGIPQRVVLDKAERYWNEVLAPTVPNMKQAFDMYMEGVISRKEFNQYCAREGWGSVWHDKLYAMLDRDPDEYMAFGMSRRGLIRRDEMLRCFKIRGFDEKWHSALESYLYRIPSSYDLMRMADFTPLEPIWVAEMLRKNGFDDATVLRMVEVLEKRPLREEVRSVAGRYVWEYQIGRLDLDTLKENLTKMGMLPKEIALWVLWAELRYADELIDEQVEIIKLRVEKGDITTKETIIEELKALGIREEKANLMAEDMYWRWLVA